MYDINNVEYKLICYYPDFFENKSFLVSQGELLNKFLSLQSYTANVARRRPRNRAHAPAQTHADSQGIISSHAYAHTWVGVMKWLFSFVRVLGVTLLLITGYIAFIEGKMVYHCFLAQIIPLVLR